MLVGQRMGVTHATRAAYLRTGSPFKQSIVSCKILILICFHSCGLLASGLDGMHCAVQRQGLTLERMPGFAHFVWQAAARIFTGSSKRK